MILPEQYNEDRQMSKGVIKAIVFGIVFLVAIVVFGFATNHTNEDLTTEMKEATFPVVYLYYGDEQVNELFGYKSEMDARYMRDSITPIDTDRILPVKIQTYNYDVDAVSYEIRSMDTSRLIADSEVEDYTNDGGSISADFQIQNLLNEGEEYLLILKLKSGDDTLYYYTRIMESANCYVKECMDFAMNFHNATLSKDTASTLATYVEPNSSADNSNLNKVTINSTLNQISWANFVGNPQSEATISVKEINASYNVIVLNYVMTSAGTDGELEYYNVEEYYRVRYTNDRMYLLNFERNMNQIFRGENNNLYNNNSIQLGIRDNNVQYMANETGNIICFVQEGELWSYNAEGSSLSQVFSFRGYEGIDDRENNNQHGIKIIKTDEAGSIDFVVYGYMNRGNHEGEVGISVYHYDSVANTVEEELFIPSKQSYEVMKAELGQLMYENENGQFYIMMNGSVYEIDMSTLKYKEIISGLTENSYAVSESNQYIAYLEGGNSNSATTLTVLNLESLDKFQINADAGDYVRPLGFMENDFIYGEASASALVVDSAGNTFFPMHCVRIVDTESKSHDQLKEYQKDGYFVSGIEISGYTIYLNRVQYNGVAYVDADQDTIMNREADKDEVVTVGSSVTDDKETQYQLVLSTAEDALSAKKLLTPKQIVLESSKDIKIDESNQSEQYYAYARGEVLAATSDVSEAIRVANDNMGVVIGNEQQYIWKRARKSSQNTIDVAVGQADAASGSVAKSISAMIGLENLNVGVQALIDRGDTPSAILKDTLKENTVLDLTGCDLDEMLYYVNNATPVLAMTSASDAVLLVGYDADNVTIFNPVTGTTYKQPLKDATEMFRQNGNVFLAYLKN